MQLSIPDSVKFDQLENLRKQKTEVDYAFAYSIVERTEGFNGNQLKHLINRAGFIAGDENCPCLCRAHLEKALHEHVKHSVPGGLQTRSIGVDTGDDKR